MKGFIRQIRKWFSSVRDKVIQFWLENFVMYLAICQSNEHVYVGKRLWKAIMEAVPEEQWSDIQIWVKKYPCVEKDGTLRYEYMMFANPDLSDYRTPSGQKPLTVPLQFNVFGHIGFQCVQPTPAEIVYEYNIKADFHDRIMLKVDKVCVNGDYGFVITNKVIGKPKPFSLQNLAERNGDDDDVELNEIIKQ